MVALDVFGSVLGSCWELLSFPIPGLDGVTGKHLVIALILMNVVVAAVSLTFGFGGSSQRSGLGGKHRISAERKNDEK